MNRVVQAWLAAALAAATVSSLAAQQPEEPKPQPSDEPKIEEVPRETPPKEPKEEAKPAAVRPHRVNFLIEAGSWVAQTVGIDYLPATRHDPSNPLATDVIDLTPGTTSSELRYRIAIGLPESIGTVSFVKYSHDEQQEVLQLTPGQFVWGELLAFPELAGVNNDGLADGYGALTDTRLRDYSIRYSRAAFSGPHVRADWFAGIRRVHHERSLFAAYFALAPGLPALLPPLGPRPDLDPLPDVALSESQYDGRGLEGGLELVFPVFHDRIQVEGGFAVGVLRGKLDAQYQSLNAAYLLTDDEGTTILSPPYDEFTESMPNPSNPNGPPLFTVDSITQIFVINGLSTRNLSTTSAVIDVHVGVRGRIWRQLEAFVGFRNTQYEDVGVDVRPQLIVTDFGTVREGSEETFRSAGYEGIYWGLAYQFGF
ncbi:MAG TPA: hypothetical protein VJS92_08625 [Candidatus Polarisedimenticolaceae bacterium]|nr:hypothetical protein [Candidatus Polarisedimenticolaceae bacterium]